MTIERYIARRRYFEVAGWLVLVAMAFVANVGVISIEHTRYGVGTPAWEVLVWESTSHVATLLVIPLILLFDRWFPISSETWRRSVVAHAILTIPWALAHVAIMYWGRVWIYRIMGDNSGYWWPDWWGQFGYEYLKDFRTYLFFLAIIYLYRFVLRRAQGEAGYVSEGDESGPVEVTDRFLIKKLGREFLVRAGDIDWIEASGNYVNLHVGRRVYPLRETMNGISERLMPLGFQRVHRSATVNIDRIVEIFAYDTGDGEARLVSDVSVPISRRFKKDLRARLA